MFTEEELVAFFSLIKQFVTDTRMSASACAKLFGVSAPTMARWVRQSMTEGKPTMTAFRYNAQPVLESVQKLNSLNAASHGALYSQTRSAKTADRVALLNRAIHTHN